MSIASVDAEAAGIGAAGEEMTDERGRHGVRVDRVLGAVDAPLERGDLHLMGQRFVVHVVSVRQPRACLTNSPIGRWNSPS
jgi:hypothetical protein